jgi:hypothetical protein
VDPDRAGLDGHVYTPYTPASSVLFGLEPGQVADTPNDCYTPRWIFDAAGLVFDLDVAAPLDPDRRTCPARRYYTPVEDGLAQPWEGLVWMNPPYSATERWVNAWAWHGWGLALTPTWGENHWRGTLLAAADTVALVYPVFTRPDGSQLRPIAACALAGVGPGTREAVARVAAADRYAAGAYHVRPE